MRTRTAILLLCLLAIVSQAGAVDCGDVEHPAFTISFVVNEGEKVGHEILVINEDAKDPCDMLPVITYLAPVPRVFRMSSFVPVDPNRVLGKMNWCAGQPVNDVNMAVVLSQTITFEPNFVDAGTYRLPYRVSDRDNNGVAVVEVRVNNVNRPPFLIAGQD
jgi:hypothetical protein